MSLMSVEMLGNLQCNSRVDELTRAGVDGVDNTSGAYTFEASADKLTIPTTAVVLGERTASRCGQNIVFSAAATAVGRDYLGQIMTETVAVGEPSLKAFAVVNSLSAGTATWGVSYGLPYAGASDADASGAITAAVVTDPSTALLGDVRGTVIFTASPDGATAKSFTYVTKADNLHGVAQV